MVFRLLEQTAGIAPTDSTRARTAAQLRQYAALMDREHESWQSGAAGSCVTIESPAGPLELWVLGNQGYRVKAPSGEQVVASFVRLLSTLG
jgi:hypothetical protein